MQGVSEIFAKLSIPETKEGVLSFRVAPIENTTHRIGKDIYGWPALLLKSSTASHGIPIRLEHLEVEYNLRCRLINEEGVTEGLYTVIRCIDSNIELTNYFLHTVQPLLYILGDNPETQQVTKLITALVELFRSLTQPHIKSISGLWAELFVISHSTDPLLLMSAWHESPQDKYDFSYDFQRLEVKSSSFRSRIHHFSLEQLNPPINAKALIASVFVEINGGGVSLNDLVEEINWRLSGKPELQVKLYKIVAATLGNNLKQGNATRFDKELAVESLHIYNSNDVPRVSSKLPPGVSEVHFRSDLSHCRQIEKSQILIEGGMFSSLVRH